jgi:hypothetical protein
MKPPLPTQGFMAYDPQGRGDIDTLRRAAASCHSAVAGITGETWISCVRAGWSVRRIIILPADQPMEELDRPGESFSGSPPVPDLDQLRAEWALAKGFVLPPEPPIISRAAYRRSKGAPKPVEIPGLGEPGTVTSWLLRCGDV